MTEEPALRYTVDEYKKLQVGIEATISRYSGLHDAKISTIEDYIHNHLIVCLHAYVWSKHDPVTISYPSSWWQHFKQWLKDTLHLPLTVGMTSQTIYQVTMYPDITTKSPTQELRIAKLHD